MNKVPFFLAAILLSLAPVTARANPDDGLYAPVAPEGSAFVRFINAGPDASKPEIAGKRFDNIEQNEVGPYVPVKAEKTALMLGNAKTSETLEKGAYYTAVPQDGALVLLKDQPVSNRAKAVAALYNLSDEAVSLKTDAGDVAVIEEVEPGKSGYREINGVPVSLAIYDGNKKLADIGSVDLKRGQATSVIVTQDDGKLQARAVQATTDTTQ